jgi:hypothetical protein
MRHLPFFIAGDRHGLPLLVRAPQRLLRFMGKLLCMGLILQICRTPAPWGLDYTHNRLATGVHVNVLHRDLLLAFASMSVQRLK